MTDPDAILIAIDDDLATAREALKRALGNLVQIGASEPGNQWAPLGLARTGLGDALGYVHRTQWVLEPEITAARRVAT